jgi:signal transduction histidine kinase
MVGIVHIESIIDDFLLSVQHHTCNQEEKQQEHIIQSLLSVKQSLQDITTTNSFMLMTINRCLDYTKVSKGMKLIAKKETVALEEAIQLPLQCMKSLQNKINIILKSINFQEICSHIITDKQWLQENLLCLLSNAVKYSIEGEVSVQVRLVSLSDLVSTPKKRRKKRRPSLSSRNNQQIQHSYLPIDLSAKGMRSTTRHPLEPSASTATMATVNNNNVTNSAKSLIGLELPNSLSPYNSHDSNDSDNNINNISNQVEDKSYMTFNTSSHEELNRSESEPSSYAEDEIVENHSDELSLDLNTKMILFEIEDNGIGVSEEIARSLFNPFQQAQRLAGGTGLGLFSMSYYCIARKMWSEKTNRWKTRINFLV